jgi:hypothetical protein
MDFFGFGKDKPARRIVKVRVHRIIRRRVKLVPAKKK